MSILNISAVTIAIGNGIVSLISGSKIFESQSTELFFFAAVLIVNQVIFACLASKYKCKNNESPAKEILLEK